MTSANIFSVRIARCQISGRMDYFAIASLQNYICIKSNNTYLMRPRTALRVPYLDFGYTSAA